MATSHTKDGPYFIAICGGEGSGKSTVLKTLRERYPHILTTREPGGSPFAEDIRKLILEHPEAKNASAETMQALFWAARHDHIARTILPALAKGQHIVSDRFVCCTFAYQIYGQKASHLEDFFWQAHKVYVGKNAPDLYIFLDVEPEVGLKRVLGRPGKPNHFDEQKVPFHERIREGYLAFFAHKDAGRHVIIDANQTQEKVLADIIDQLDPLIGAPIR